VCEAVAAEPLDTTTMHVAVTYRTHIPCLSNVILADEVRQASSGRSCSRSRAARDVEDACTRWRQRTHGADAALQQRL
jgi:hypothetical protein